MFFFEVAIVTVSDALGLRLIMITTQCAIQLIQLGASLRYTVGGVVGASKGKNTGNCNWEKANANVRTPDSIVETKLALSAANYPVGNVLTLVLESRFPGQLESLRESIEDLRELLADIRRIFGETWTRKYHLSSC